MSVLGEEQVYTLKAESIKQLLSVAVESNFCLKDMTSSHFRELLLLYDEFSFTGCECFCKMS